MNFKGGLMANSDTVEKTRKQKISSRYERLMPFGVVFAGLASMMVFYLGYDLVKTRMSPCESIFRQTAVALSTKLKFLKAEGELEIGHDKMAELSERAQMTALNLKTCCTVLDAGRLNPEQFITCKAKARHYETRVDEIATLVAPVKPNASTMAKAMTRSDDSRLVATPVAAPATAPGNVAKKIAAAIEASKSFNQHVVKVRKDQVLETLEAIEPEHVDVAAKEHEVNNNLLQSNRVKLDTWVTGAVGASGDVDVYSFTTPDVHRDWITIELQNRSTGLEPNLVLYDAEKTGFASAYKTTTGADIKYSFVAKPNTTYFAKLSAYYGKSTGVYLLRVKTGKAYDSFEPNERILDAKPLQRGKTIDASVMDGQDVDYYALGPSESDEDVILRIENTSNTLHPSLTVFDGQKNGIKTTYSTTAGADVEVKISVAAKQKIYVRVHDYYSKARGSYRLTATVKQKEKAGQ